MGNSSVKVKLISLSGFLLLSILALSALSLWETAKFGQMADELVEKDLPAVKNMDLADMMHDALRGVSYRAIIVSEFKDPEMVKSTQEEYNEFSKNFRTYLSNIEKLPLNPEIKAALKEIKGPSEDYVQLSEKIVTQALSGKRYEALGLLVEFQKLFEVLEGKMGHLGELIEKMTETGTLQAEESSKKAKSVSVSLSIASILLGFIASLVIIRDLIRKMAETMKKLDANCSRLARASADGASSASELSEAATEQASSLQETMSSVEEISAMVSQNADSAVKAKTLVETNEKVSEEGSRGVDDMLRAIGEVEQTNDEVLKQMETSNKEFNEIVKIITEIGEKTNVINEIVFQTKLLSFNASVEAARAGEHGKGFAVVAEEVGNLAQMSGNAAKEITDMLSGSIKRVNGIVETTKSKVEQLVEVGRDKIAMSQATAQKCKELLAKMAENAKLMSGMIGEISNASTEQAQGVQEISKAISQLDQVTQQNTAVAQSSSLQAEELNSLVTSLTTAVDSLGKFIGTTLNSEDSGAVTQLDDTDEKERAKVISIHSKVKGQKLANSLMSGQQSKGPTKLASGDDVTSVNSEPSKFEEF